MYYTIFTFIYTDFDFEIFSAPMKNLENFQNGDKIPNCTGKKIMRHNNAARFWFGFIHHFKVLKIAFENFLNVTFQKGVSPKSKSKTINERIGIRR